MKIGRKKEILNEIQNIFKKYQLKVIVFISLDLILMMFFWYYVIVFCQIYSRTQTSWLWDSFLSILSEVVIEFLFSLGYAKLYRIGVESNIKFIYKLSLFLYDFSF